ADDGEPRWNEIHLHEGTIVPMRNLVDSWHIRNNCAAADVDENLIRGEDFAARVYFRGRFKASVRLIDRTVRHALKPALEPAAGPRGDFILALFPPFHVYAEPTCNGHTKVGAAPRKVSRIGARYHRLGGNASGIHAGAAEQVPFNDRYPHARRRQA